MNRLKKEQVKNPKSKVQQKQDHFAEFLHGLFFSEESDWMYDDAWSKNDRKQGINPMSEAYTNRVNQKRKLLGVSPLGSDGMPVDGSSRELCNALSRVLDIEQFEGSLASFQDLVKRT